MMFGKIFDIYCENYVEHVSAVCLQNYVEHVSTVCLQNAEFCYIITFGSRLSTQTRHTNCKPSDIPVQKTKE